MITLVTGGCRSGKSDFALQLADKFERKAFVATAVSFDAEIAARIAKHQRERPESYQTIEASCEVAPAIREAFATGCQVVVLDCLTIWINNLMMKHTPAKVPECRELNELLELLSENNFGELIIVTNEVGMGVVPENQLARLFRDIAGRLNSQVAKLAGRVYLTACGLPLQLK